MSNLAPVIKRELQSYFSSPIAYVVIVMFLVISGYFFQLGMAVYHELSFRLISSNYRLPLDELTLFEKVMRPWLQNLTVILLLFIPLITMRLFAEEKKTGTIELLLTYPIRDMEAVLGKYCAALLVFIAMLGLTAPYLLILAQFKLPYLPSVGAGYLGVLLLGASFIAIGMFISTLTENQIIAAVSTFAVLLLFWIVGWTVSESLSTGQKVVQYLSLLDHFDDFAKGVIDTKDVVYYGSVMVFFVFLTLRSLETKKWRG